MSVPGRFSKRSAFPFPLSMRASFSLTACGTSSESMFECLQGTLVGRLHEEPSPIKIQQFESRLQTGIQDVQMRSRLIHPRITSVTGIDGQREGLSQNRDHVRVARQAFSAAAQHPDHSLGTKRN